MMEPWKLAEQADFRKAAEQAADAATGPGFSIQPDDNVVALHRLVSVWEALARRVMSKRAFRRQRGRLRTTVKRAVAGGRP